MMTRLGLLVLSLALALAVPAHLSFATESKETAAVTFVQKLGDKALSSLTDKAIARATRESRVRTLLEENFDLPTIGRFALGTYWRTATAAEKTEYMNLFEDMIVQTYTSRFEDYSGQSFKVIKSSKSGENDFIVNSQIIQKDGPPVSVDWRVREKNGQMKIVDVIVENISMSVTQRSDFSSVIQNGGGKVKALIASLRDRKKAKKT